MQCQHVDSKLPLDLDMQARADPRVCVPRPCVAVPPLHGSMTPSTLLPGVPGFRQIQSYWVANLLSSQHAASRNGRLVLNIGS